MRLLETAQNVISNTGAAIDSHMIDRHVVKDDLAVMFLLSTSAQGCMASQYGPLEALDPEQFDSRTCLAPNPGSSSASIATPCGCLLPVHLGSLDSRQLLFAERLFGH